MQNAMLFVLASIPITSGAGSLLALDNTEQADQVVAVLFFLQRVAEAACAVTIITAQCGPAAVAAISDKTFESRSLLVILALDIFIGHDLAAL